MNLDNTFKNFLKTVMDVLIPAVDDLPGAGGLDLISELQRMSDQHNKFTGIIDHAVKYIFSNIPADHDQSSHKMIEVGIRALEQDNPELFGLFIEIIYLAYYSDPRVHLRIGWKTGPLQPEGHPMPPWDESILETVRKRDPLWVKA
jgi:hypothetical protein